MKWILNPLVYAIAACILLGTLMDGRRVKHLIGSAIAIGSAAFYFKLANMYATVEELPAAFEGFSANQNGYFPYMVITAGVLGFLLTSVASSETEYRAKLKLPWKFLFVPELIAGMGLITRRSGAFPGFLEGLGICYAITGAFCLLVGLFGRFVKMAPKTTEEKAALREAKAAARKAAAAQRQQAAEDRRIWRKETAEKLAHTDLKAEIVKKGPGILCIAAAVVIVLVKFQVLPEVLFGRMLAGTDIGAAVMETWLEENALPIITTPLFCVLLILTGVAVLYHWEFRDFINALTVPAGFAMAAAPWLPQVLDMKIGSWTFEGGEGAVILLYLAATAVCWVLYVLLTFHDNNGPLIRNGILRAIVSVAATLVTLPLTYCVVLIACTLLNVIFMYIAIPVMALFFMIIRYNNWWNDWFDL